MITSPNTNCQQPIQRLEMEMAIESLFVAGIASERQMTDLIDALTPDEVSRQEVAFNVEMVACEKRTLWGKELAGSLIALEDPGDRCPNKAAPDRQATRPIMARACRQIAALACYFVAIYAVGLSILASEIGIVAAAPLALKTCAGKSLVAALVGPWIHRLTGASTP